jgi:hypothetical protein
VAWAGVVASIATLATPATLSEKRKAASMCLRTFMMVLLYGWGGESCFDVSTVAKALPRLQRLATSR